MPVVCTLYGYQDSALNHMKTEVDYTCDGQSMFYSEELNYTKSFTLSCEQDLIFGSNFPYWKIPGTLYPDKKELICALPTKCYNFIDIDFCPN